MTKRTNEGCACIGWGVILIIVFLGIVVIAIAAMLGSQPG
jgi:uncharacterized membrane protein